MFAVGITYPLISLLTKGYIRVCSFVRVKNSPKVYRTEGVFSCLRMMYWMPSGS